MRKDVREHTIAVIGRKIVPIPIYEMDELPELVRSGKLKTTGGINDESQG